ncbi:MAG: restriction endonuclease [Saprospiraceae bacterium]|nr:restriction endonuclease [Saprospiraceae bacterium]
MSKRAATNFQEINLDHYLYSSIPLRFQGVDPPEFEDFIAFLFKQNGYELVQTSYSADFGADIIVKKDGLRTAVQVKRYFELHKVGVSDINQVIGAQQYYQCDQALMITTSSYTPAAKELAVKSGVILWDWERLEKAISDTFFEGQYHQDYYKAYPVDISSTNSDLLKIEIMDVYIPDLESENSRILIRLSNLTDIQHKIKCDLPILLTTNQFQFSAIKFVEESFSSGILYPNATIEIICEFSRRQLSDYDRKDRLLLPVHFLQSQEYIVLEQKLGSIKNECFLVTFYYGRTSAEYRQMIALRDQVLQKNLLGRSFISAYYFLGSRLVDYLSHEPKMVNILRPLVRGIVKTAIRNKR